MKNQILILNGSPHGSKGNCAKLIARIEKSLKVRGFVPGSPTGSVQVVNLANRKYSKTFRNEILGARALIFVTGTYWDSWGSPMQKLLEEMTELEGSSELLGKPCAVFVLMHSVGGKGILSRLQGVLSSMGFLIPPMSGMVYSLVSQLAASKPASKHQKDFWCLEDVENVLENLQRSLEIKIQWFAWPVDLHNFRKTWLK